MKSCSVYSSVSDLLSSTCLRNVSINITDVYTCLCTQLILLLLNKYCINCLSILLMTRNCAIIHKANRNILVSPFVNMCLWNCYVMGRCLILLETGRQIAKVIMSWWLFFSLYPNFLGYASLNVLCHFLECLSSACELNSTILLGVIH